MISRVPPDYYNSSLILGLGDTVEPRLSEPLWSPKILRCSESQNRSNNENQNGIHDQKSTGERDRQLIVLSSIHRQRVVCFSTWINCSEAKRTGYLGCTASHKAATWPLMIFKAAQ